MADGLFSFLSGGNSFIHGSKRDREAAKQNYSVSAQLVHIVWKAKDFSFKRYGLLLTFVLPLIMNLWTFRVDQSNFIYVHQKFVDPEEIVWNDNASLHIINK